MGEPFHADGEYCPLCVLVLLGLITTGRRDARAHATAYSRRSDILR